MGVPFELEQRWPELFEQLDAKQRRAVLNTFAANWHEGWVPNREDVANLTDFVSGVIDSDEYDRRSNEAIEARRRERERSRG